MNWNQGSFRTSKSAREMQAEAEKHFRRRRTMVPPTINFNELKDGPAPVEMPEFQKDQSSHTPILPEDAECHSPKK